MNEQIIIDDQEISTYISEELTKKGVNLSKENILAVLDLEFEFLRLKGVIEEDATEESDENYVSVLKDFLYGMKESIEQLEKDVSELKNKNREDDGKLAVEILSNLNLVEKNK
ncbi:hypothetical protein AF332_12065 [Sporosarcina globispora]|uniref:Uncharacterized protein n=1 Tax=Sporosarcina globispora TaxID=1459 RepID=A0A0M0GC69_SPOGL|nr:YozD family protein [Sporosarcina globispora]KON87490.1 hypothetical protein AF332_12065 [Sporosarcina globispora]